MNLLFFIVQQVEHVLEQTKGQEAAIYGSNCELVGPHQILEMSANHIVNKFVIKLNLDQLL